MHLQVQWLTGFMFPILKWNPSLEEKDFPLYLRSKSKNFLTSSFKQYLFDKFLKISSQFLFVCIFSIQLCTEHANSFVPVDHPHYARVKRVANRLLKANKHMPQIYTKYWTITVLDEPSMNAFVLPVSLVVNSYYLVYYFSIYFRYSRMETFLFLRQCWICVQPTTSWQWF